MNRLIEIYGLEQTVRLDEASLPLTIGGGDAQIRLPGTETSLAWVGESHEHLFLQPAETGSPGIIYHNDEVITASVWLKSGDSTRLGDYLIRWQISGQRLEIRVSKSSMRILTPPVEPPESLLSKVGSPPPEVKPETVSAEPKASKKMLRALVFGLFALLLTCALFVLLANPLTVTVTPAPDRLSISGFPPVFPFGERYLGLSGSYVVHAEKQGYRPLAESVDIESGGSSYALELEKLPGLFDVQTDPPGVTLVVDGAPLGETPLKAVEIPAGNRNIRFEHPRYFTEEQTVVVKGFGEQQSLQAILLPAWAMVRLETEPPGATLSVDGETLGETPLELELIDGVRQLTFSLDHFLSLEVELDISAGQDLKPPAYRLQPSPASLRITTDPAGATLTVDGEFKGQTPLALSIPSQGEHLVQVSAAGYLEKSQKVKLAPEEERVIVFTMEPEFGILMIAATPPEASLYIDGKKQAKNTGQFRLSTRMHNLELKAKGYQSLTRKVTPQAGYSQRIDLALKSSQAVAQPKVAPAPSGNKTFLGQRLVLIKPTPFLMGASRSEPGRRANESEHQVSLQRSFYISEREVTNREFLQFNAQHSSGVAGRRSLEIDSHPVVNVTWDDAARFMNWLSRKDGLTPFYREENGKMLTVVPHGPGYRLPTEAEWAFVARVAGQREPVRYPWSGSFPPKSVAANLADESARHILPVVIEGYNDGFAATAPTGSFAANPVGIFDLGGNAAEWCHDYYSAHAASAGTGPDPMGTATGSHRVVRGSSWRDASITELRFSYRRYSREATDDIGFRIARYAR